MTPVTAHEWLSVEALMAYLGISRSSVERVKRRIPYVKAPGIGIRFRRVDVDRYLAEHVHAPPTPRRGTPVARAPSDTEEVLPGVTRGELIAKAGF